MVAGVRAGDLNEATGATAIATGASWSDASPVRSPVKSPSKYKVTRKSESGVDFSVTETRTIPKCNCIYILE